MEENNKFNLEHQYQLYLKRIALSEDQMHSEQKKQLRQAFMGACGQLLILLRDDLTDIEEEEAIKALDSMRDQVINYFLEETNREN